jgi:hypothetical protein
MPVAYLILDQNVLRKPELKVAVVEQLSTRFVLPDLAFLEMTKNEHWEETLKRSLNTLSRIPRRAYVAYSINDALARELRSLRSAVGNMLSKPASIFLRDILLWVRTGTETPAIRRIRADPAEDKLALIADHLSHAENKKSIAGLIDGTKRHLSEETQKALRAGKLSEEEELELVHQLARRIAYGVLEDRGVQKEVATTFLIQRPVFYRYLIVNAWNCVRWISTGGFDGFKETSVSNEMLDHQYVLTASCFHGVLSNDARVNEAYKALITVLPREV